MAINGWLSSLLIVWVLILNLLSTQALAETLHHHDGDNLCLQHQLLEQLTTLLPLSEAVFPAPTWALPPIELGAVKAPKPIVVCPNNRGPPFDSSC